MSKRKHNTLTLRDKGDILQQLENGVSASTIMNQYDIGRSTIWNIKQKKDKILLALSTQSDSKRTLKNSLNPQMEEKLFAWYTKLKAQGAHVSGTMMCQQAKQLHKEISGKDNFQASSGWLNNFKRRYELRQRDNPLDGPVTVEQFQKKLLEKVQEMELNPDQVYNAKKVRFAWNFLLGPRLHITSFVPCINATGSHKLQLLVTGKSSLPDSYENCSELPVVYLFQKAGPDATNLLFEWFHNHFVPEVKSKLTELNLPHKALLLMEKNTDLPECLCSEDKNIQVMFLPTFCWKIQPLDKEIVEKIKIDYKLNLISMAPKATSTKDVAEIYETSSLDFLQATSTLRDAWLSMPAELIRESWHRLWPDLSNLLEDGNHAMNRLQDRLFEDGQTSSGTIEETDDCNKVIIKTDIEINEEDLKIDIDNFALMKEEEDSRLTNDTFSDEEALKCFDVCIQWCMKNDVADDQLLVLRQIRGQVATAHGSKIKQEPFDPLIV